MFMVKINQESKFEAVMLLVKKLVRNMKMPRTMNQSWRTVVTFVAAAAVAGVAVVVVNAAAFVVAVDACWVWVRASSYAGRGGRFWRSTARTLGI